MWKYYVLIQYKNEIVRRQNAFDKRTNQPSSSARGISNKWSLDGACRERKFSVQSRPQSYEMSDIAVATTPLTLHQNMLHKTNKLNGKDKSDVS
jgi:hypothetical protein